MRSRLSIALYIVTILLTGFGGYFFLVLRPARMVWEKSLWRHPGRPVAAKITNAPASALSLPESVILEVFPITAEDTFVLRLRDGKDDRWMRLLLPEKTETNGIVERAWVRDLKLKSFEQRSDGVRIQFTCNWQWGGQEGGLIFLGPDLSFLEFGISW